MLAKLKVGCSVGKSIGNVVPISLLITDANSSIFQDYLSGLSLVSELGNFKSIFVSELLVLRCCAFDFKFVFQEMLVCTVEEIMKGLLEGPWAKMIFMEVRNGIQHFTSPGHEVLYTFVKSKM